MTKDKLILTIDHHVGPDPGSYSIYQCVNYDINLTNVFYQTCLMKDGDGPTLRIVGFTPNGELITEPYDGEEIS